MPHQCTTCGRTFADGSKEMLAGCPDCGGNKFQFAPSLDASGEIGDGSGSTVPPKTTRSEPGTTESDRDGQSNTPGDSVETSSTEDQNRGLDRPWPESARPNESENRPPTETTRQRNQPTQAPTEGDCSPDQSASDRSPTSTERNRSTPPSAEPPVQTDSDAPVQTDSAAPVQTGSDDSTREDSAQATARSDVVTADELPPIEGESRFEFNDDRPDPARGQVVSEPAAEQPSLEDLRDELNQQFESIKIVNPGQYELNLMELYNREEYIISLQEDGRYVIDVPDSWRQPGE